MTIRSAVPADGPNIETVVAAAFGEPADGRVVRMMRALDLSAATRVSLVAEDTQGALMGHVRLSRAWLDTRAELVEVLTLTPLAVAPENQGTGIGTRLIAEALARGGDLGFPAVFLEGDWRYYGPRGFAAAEALGFQRPSDRIPGPAFQVALLGTHRKGMTGRLVYPEALWLTGCVGLRDPDLARVEDSLRA